MQESWVHAGCAPHCPRAANFVHAPCGGRAKPVVGTVCTSQAFREYLPQTQKACSCGDHTVVLSPQGHNGGVCSTTLDHRAMIPGLVAHATSDPPAGGFPGGLNNREMEERKNISFAAGLIHCVCGLLCLLTPSSWTIFRLLCLFLPPSCTVCFIFPKSRPLLFSCVAACVRLSSLSWHARNYTFCGSLYEWHALFQYMPPHSRS